MHKENRDFLKINGGRLRDPNYQSYDRSINTDLGGILEDYVPGGIAAESKNEYSSHKVMPPVGPGKNYVRAQ